MKENNRVVTTTRNGTLYLTYQMVNLNRSGPASFLGHARAVNIRSGFIQTGEKLRDSPGAWIEFGNSPQV